MSRFNKLSHAIWHSKYHVVWTPKYRYKVLKGVIKEEVENCIHLFSEQKRCKIKVLNVQEDHAYLTIEAQPKVSISEMLGILKGRTGIREFERFKQLKQRPYWGNHFWDECYCVDMIGLDSELTRRYVEYQENKKRS